MNPAAASATPAGETTAESAGNEPLLLLLGFSVLWLLVSGALALLASIQVHRPGFFADCSLLNYGHARALEQTAFVYGWIGNAGFALVLWILGRLSGEPLRALPWAGAGGLFWNAAVAIGLIGIATGAGNSYPDLEMPGYAQPLMLAAYAAIGMVGVLAWTGRRHPVLFASQWYGVALLFLFPWVFSLAQLMLVWTPVRGVVQAIAGGWVDQCLWTMWMAPLALTGAYYVVPKVTGKILPSYDLATLGFWCLIAVGGWTGGRHLIGGPVPAWIPTLGIVASVVLLPHYLIVLLNLRGAFSRGSGLSFIAFGLAAYVLGGFVDAATGMRGVALVTQFTWFGEAVRQLALYAGISMILFGTLYYALPRLSGRPWAFPGLRCAHFGLSILGLVLLVVTLAGAGLAQGAGLNNPAVSFAAIGDATRPWLRLTTVAEAILLVGNLLLAINFAVTVGRGRLQAAKEALVS